MGKAFFRPFLLALALFFPIFSAVFSSEPRIVSLSPAVTEIVCQLGGRPYLVGRSSACDFPAEVKSLPVAGDLGCPEVETVLALRPTLVVTDLAAPHPGWEQLARLDIPVLQLSSDHLADYPVNVKKLGQVLHCEEAAEREVSRFNAELANLRDQKHEPPVKLLILLGIDPLVSCNGDTFISEVAAATCAVNVLNDARLKYFRLELESLSQKKVDAVLITGMEKLYSELPRQLEIALSGQKFAVISGIPPELLLRLAPRLTDGMKQLQSALLKL